MIIIDTNVYSALDNGSISAVAILKSQTSICVPIVVVGELQFGFMNGNRQEDNKNRLGKFLAQDKIDVLNLTLETAEIYGRLSTYCKKVGRALSNNDIWIAALALESNAVLATYDKDFEVFAGMFGDKLVVISAID